MIGRKLKENEDKDLIEGEPQGSHLIASEVFHENREKFSKGVIMNEGLIKHYMRHFY